MPQGMVFLLLPSSLLVVLAGHIVCILAKAADEERLSSDGPRGHYGDYLSPQREVLS